MDLPTPPPPPLDENTGDMTLTLAVIINVNLEQMGCNGADAAHRVSDALLAATLPEGAHPGNTLLQLAVHAPR